MNEYKVNEGVLVVFKNGTEVTFKPDTTIGLYLNEDKILYIQYLK